MTDSAGFDVPAPLEPKGSRPGAATVRSRLMLGVASSLVSSPHWPAKQVRIDFRAQGAAEWDTRLFASDGLDGVDEVLAGRAHFAILNPATALVPALARTAEAAPDALAAIATVPSHDQLGLAVRGGLGVRTLSELADLRPPLRLSLRGGRPNHAVQLVVEDVLGSVGVTLRDVEAWGGGVRYDEGHAHEPARDGLMERQAIDACFDEGIYNWADRALAHGYRFLAVDELALERLEKLGYRRSSLSRQIYRGLEADVPTVDFSGFLVYTTAAAPDELVASFCRALFDSHRSSPWQGGSSLPLERMVADAVDAPIPVPFHPVAARFWSDAGLTPAEVR